MTPFRNINLLDWTLVACLIPLFWLSSDIVFDHLGANPIQALEIRLGDWSLRFLCMTLAITPIQIVTKWRGMTEYRRLFGLYTFFYATLHVTAYFLVDHALAWRIIAVDIVQSSYIWFGLVTYIIIFLLAITTHKSAKRGMGKSWKKLHRLIYLSSFTAMMHYFWQLKGNLVQPFLYLILILFLLAFRIIDRRKDRQLNPILIPKSRE
ncbi:MAG: protein-methionine-sulfoxide reductase heme-binding subunit MsrQ [Methylomonas sp.]|jgi:sulfoxide reductase heme-binding subunit YedZ